MIAQRAIRDRAFNRKRNRMRRSDRKKRMVGRRRLLAAQPVAPPQLIPREALEAWIRGDFGVFQ